MKTINEIEKYFYRDPRTQVDHIGSQGIRKVVFTKDDMSRHGGRIPYEILEYSRTFLYTYLEESKAGYGFIFSNEPIEFIIYPIDITNVFEERGFWNVLTFGLANRTLKQTLADVRKFIRSDKNQTQEPVIQPQLEIPPSLIGKRVCDETISEVREQLDDRPDPQYTFEQVKQLVTIIRGDMDDQLIKQLLEIEQWKSL